MQCNHCKDEVKEFDKTRKAHLVLFKNANDGHIHVHGDLSKKEDCRELLVTASDELGLSLASGKLDIDEIVFHNRQRIGDMLMFSCGVRDFKAAYPDVKVNIISTASHIFDFNPNIDRSVIPDDKNTLKIGPSELTNASNRLDWHFANAFRVSIENKLGIKFPQGESRPDIYFSEEEYHAERAIKDPYWVICVNGEKGWGCKMYPFDKWQVFVSQNSDTKFVQIGTKEDNPPRLQGANVIDYVGKTQDKQTGIRDLFKLFLNAEGSIGLVSFHMHLSGALYKPCIVVAGAREPVSFTRYPGHQYLSNDGTLPCAINACWHCNIDTCTNLVIREDSLEKKIPKCADIIEPEDLTRALNAYYKGGRLTKGVPSDKPPRRNTLGVGYGVNVVKDTRMKVKEAQVSNMYGMEWNGAHLMKEDWDFITSLINKHNVNSVLEFGAGLSTLLFTDLGLEKFVSYESQQRWIDRTLEKNPKCNIKLWDENDAPIEGTYDLAFVDGPSGGDRREHSIRLASLHAKIVIVHDGYGSWEKKWQEKYLKGHAKGPTKGGRRCYMWDVDSDYQKNQVRLQGGEQDGKIIIKKEPVEEASTEASETGGALQKTVKIVSTARGWGGCARSITTIMKLLLEKGHHVEFIPFRNSVGSREFKEKLETELKDVKVSLTYDSIKDPCDVLFVYADDFVWEFGQPEIINAFSDLKAKKKIMMLNYRRGKVGELEWTKCWNKYMFLNTTQQLELLKVHPRVNTRVLPPCTNLEPFFDVKPDYNHSLRIVRHSSQGDTKFFNEYVYDIEKALEREDVEFNFLPGASFIQESERVKKHKRTADPKVIANFLSKGNLFWYSLPKGYMDMGPRVILEAMAAGIPVLADNWGGAKDRVTPETGWLCSKEEQLEIIRTVTPEELKKKGEAAKERAFKEFRAEKWVKEILN